MAATRGVAHKEEEEEQGRWGGHPALVAGFETTGHSSLMHNDFVDEPSLLLHRKATHGLRGGNRELLQITETLILFVSTLTKQFQTE